MVATRRASRRLQNQNGEDTDASVEVIEISDAEVSTPMKTPRRATRSTTNTPAKQTTTVSTPSTSTKSTRTRSTPARSAKKTATEVIKIDDEPEVTPAKAKTLKTPTPVKRGRGRPRKNSTVSETESVEEVITITEESAEEEEGEVEEPAKDDQMAILKTIREEQAEQEEQEENDSEPEVVAVPENDDEEEDEIQMKDSEDEDDEIAMPDDDEDEEEEDDAEKEAEEEGEEEDDDDDDEIMNFAMMAASGLDLSTKKSSQPQASNKKKLDTKAAAHTLLQGLDSGYSKANAYFKYDGNNQSVELVAEKANDEKKIKLKQQMEVASRGKIQQQIARTKTTGSKWFDMSSHELTEDAKRDFALLRMRNYLDPKKFYKSTDHKKNLPKHFQIGTVIEGAHEYKSARIARKDRRQTFTDEIMADASVRQYTKRVYSQIQRANHGQGRKKAQQNKKIRF